MRGPAISAARPCSQTAAQAASNAASPRARIAAIIPASTSPVPALASQAGAGGAKPRRPSGRRHERVRPLVDDHRTRPPRGLEGPVGLRSRQLAEQALELAFVRREDRILAAKPLRVAELGDRVRVDDLRRTGRSAPSVRTCGISPMPGPTSRQPMRSSLSSARVGLDDRGRQPVDAPRRADADIAGAGARRCRGRQRDRSGHLAGQHMDQSPRVFVAVRIERRQDGRGDLEPLARCLDADVREHHATALVHRRRKPMRRLQRAERDRQVEVRQRAEFGSPYRCRRRSVHRMR